MNWPLTCLHFRRCMPSLSLLSKARVRRLAAKSLDQNDEIDVGWLRSEDKCFLVFE